MKQLVLTLALLSSTLIGCAQPGDDDSTSVEVARIDGRNGTLRLFAEPDGSIAIAETTTSRRSTAEALIADHGATPLELYLALAPTDRDPPEALWADHRATRGDVEPRALALPLASSTGETAFDDCNSADWPGFLAGVQGTYAAKYRRWVSTSEDIWTKSTSEDTGKRRFDACVADDFGANTASVRVGHKADNEVSYTWGVNGTLSVGERFWYSSQYGDPDWQMQVMKPASGPQRSVGLGRADSPPLGIGQ